MTQQDATEDTAPVQESTSGEAQEPSPVVVEGAVDQQTEEPQRQYPQTKPPKQPVVGWHTYLQIGLTVAILGTIATLTGQTQGWHIAVIALTALASLVGMILSIIGLIRTYGGLQAGLIMLVVGAIFTTLGLSVASFVPLLRLYGAVPLVVGAVTAHVAYMRRILVAIESINARLGKN